MRLKYKIKKYFNNIKRLKIKGLRIFKEDGGIVFFKRVIDFFINKNFLIYDHEATIIKLPSNPKIIILKLDHVGDFLLGLNALEEIRIQFPSAEITLVCGIWNKQLALKTRLFEKIITFDFFYEKSELGRVYENPLPEFSAKLSERYDLAIDLRYDYDTRILLKCINAVYKVGYYSDFMPSDMTVIIPTLEMTSELWKKKHKVHAQTKMQILAEVVKYYFKAQKEKEVKINDFSIQDLANVKSITQKKVSILVLKLDSKDEFQDAISALKKLKEYYPNSSLSLLCGDWNKLIANSLGIFDNVIEFRFYDHESSKEKYFLNPAYELSRLNLGEFDYVFDLNIDEKTRELLKNFRTSKNICFYAEKIPNDNTLVIPKFVTKSLYNNKIISLHSSLKYILYSKIVYLNFTNNIPRIINQVSTQRGLVLLKNEGIEPDKIEKIIIFSPLSGSTIKNLDNEKFIKLIDKFLNEYNNIKILMVGSKGFINELSEYEKEIKNKNFINISGKTTLEDVISLLKMSVFYIGVDSGITHLAALCNIPVFAIFSGANSPEEWGPVSECSYVYYKNLECSPCHKVDISDCIFDHVCMRDIDINDLYTQLKSFWDISEKRMKTYNKNFKK